MVSVQQNIRNKIIENKYFLLYKIKLFLWLIRKKAHIIRFFFDLRGAKDIYFGTRFTTGVGIFQKWRENDAFW